MSNPTHALLVDLGTALHRAGASSARVEDSLGSLARSLGIEAQFFASPTALFAAFGAQGEQRTYLSRVDPGSVDLEPLTELDALIQQLSRREIAVGEGQRRLAQITRPRPPRPLHWLLLGHLLASISAAAFLAGAVPEMIAAAICGALVGALSWAAQRRSGLERALVPVTAALVSFVAVMLATPLAPLDVELVTLAALIVVLPGMTMTVAMTELATQHLASGISRLASAFFSFVVMAFGISLGGKLASYLFGMPVKAGGGEPVSGAAFVAAVVAPIAIAMLLRAPRREWGFVVVAGVASLYAAKLGSGWLGPQLGPFLGGFVAAACGNGYARLRQRPSAIVFVPALIMVVPGSIGFRAVNTLLGNDVTQGIETAVLTVINATALVSGMLIAALIVRPRRAL